MRLHDNIARWVLIHRRFRPWTGDDLLYIHIKLAYSLAYSGAFLVLLGLVLGIPVEMGIWQPATPSYRPIFLSIYALPLSAFLIQSLHVVADYREKHH
ncbi:hypothetical protein MnBA_41000 [Marinobacterium sp. BA1]